ncbi:MAG: amidohydrolase [Candidatus Rokuibacteriota bacterium]|nr:MAG: amidohydrolase [Candidatus Rokubacteria bacterium]
MAEDLIISADSHMNEPPDLWVKRIDTGFRDRAPRIVHEHQGKPGYWFICEGLEPRSVGGTFAAGKSAEELKAAQKAGYEAARPGGWDPVERIKDQAIDGVAAEVLYTTLGFRLFGLTDAPFQAAIFRAYNDWLAEFCRHDPRRFAGLALVPLLDVDDGVQEIQRCARMGLKGAMIMASPPEGHDYTDPRYDPFWAAAQDLRMPLSLHTNVNRYMRAMTLPHETQRTLTTLIFGGVLERFPGLTVVSAENDIGWLAHFLYRADFTAQRFRFTDPAPITLLPSEYFRRQVFATFMDDPVGIATWTFVGAGNFMWASDYPHTLATWPHSREVIARDFKGVPDDVRAKMTNENAAKLYGLLG